MNHEFFSAIGEESYCVELQQANTVPDQVVCVKNVSLTK